MFSLLVVVPLIVVFAAAAVILYQVMRTSAVDTISAFQETVATTLNTDIKSASLQLSHFVYVNDGEFLDVANRVYSSSGSSQQYLAAKELERSFNTAMVPSQNILAGLFFMKGGGTVPVKESITLPDDALRAEGWYRTALDNPNRVTIGGYDTSKTDLTANAQKGGQLVLVTAMAPNYTTDRSGRIEMVAYFTTSQVSEVPLRSRSDPGMGTTLLLDEEGQVLFGDMGREELLAWFGENGAQLPNGTFNRRAALDPDGRTRNYLFILRQVPLRVGASPPLWTKGLSWTASWVSAHCWWGWCSACCCSFSCSPGTSWTPSSCRCRSRPGPWTGWPPTTWPYSCSPRVTRSCSG